MRSATATFALLLVALNFCPAQAQDSPRPGAPGSITASPEQIAAWARELDSDLFAVREKAMLRLIEVGAAAVRPVAEAIADASPEAAWRGINVLRELALSGEDDTEEAARDAIQRLAHRQAGATARRADAMLATLDSQRQQRALAELERLGAKSKMIRTQVGLGILDVQSIEIGEDWQGQEKDLRRLRRLGEFDQIVFRRVKITEQSLAHVAALKNLKVLEIKYVAVGDAALEPLKDLKGVLAIRLYGTSVSKEGAEKLQSILSNTKIDWRQGGFLGVGGSAHPKGFAVNIVHPGSAAQKAGIEEGDVILKYQDKPIADFDALTVEISKNKPGEEIAIEILRDDQKLVKKLTLGEWDERAQP